MKVVKGDKVLFQRYKRPNEPREPDGVGIVRDFRSSITVDLLCEGEGMDYTTSIDNIKEVHGNVFDEAAK